MNSSHLHLNQIQTLIEGRVPGSQHPSLSGWTGPPPAKGALPRRAEGKDVLRASGCPSRSQPKVPRKLNSQEAALDGKDKEPSLRFFFF